MTETRHGISKQTTDHILTLIKAGARNGVTYLKVADHFEVAFSGRRRIRPTAAHPLANPEAAHHASDYVEPDEVIVQPEQSASVHTQDGPDAELARVAAEYDAWSDDNNSPQSPFVERKDDEA